MAISLLYNRLLPFWGAQLTFEDGAVLEHKNPFLALGKLKGRQNLSAGTEHFYSEAFSKSWQQAEKQLLPDQHLEKQLLWAMYQVFHAKAKALFAQQVFQLSPADVPFSAVESQLVKNLSEPGYEEELAVYQKLLNSGGKIAGK